MAGIQNSGAVAATIPDLLRLSATGPLRESPSSSNADPGGHEVAADVWCRSVDRHEN
jgi:hypothetical protein